MATINFYLDKPDSKGRCPIFLVCQHKGRKFKQFTKEKILPKYFDTRSQKAKKISGAAEVNDYLAELRERLQSVERELRRTNPRYTFDDLKAAFKDKHKSGIPLFQFLDQFIKEVESSHQRKSIKEYQTIKNDLVEYQKHYSTTLSYDKINNSFFNKYLKYLVEERENGQNTIAKKISTLKTLLNYAVKEGYNKNYTFRDFSVKKIRTEKVYLTKDELHAIYKLDLSDNKRLEKARDVFCFGCFTGLRYSDIKTLKYSEIITKKGKEDNTYKVLSFHAQKTKQLLEVPLNKYASAIIEKYEQRTDESLSVLKEGSENVKQNELVLPVCSNQKMNDYIKDVAAEAEIKTKVNVAKFLGSKRVDKTYEKHQLLSTHAARRTFAILSLEQGMRIEVLQKILGHQSIRTTMKYVFILDEVKKEEMVNTWDTFKF